MIQAHPTITVLVSAYNEEKRIARSVESILHQDFTDFELIVINDGSNDNTLSVLQTFQDKRLKVISQENQGLYPALNRGLKEAKGKYIARQDADDYSLPCRLEKQVQFLEANPNIGLLGTAYVAVDSSNNPLYIRQYPLTDELIKRDIAKYNPFCHSSVMFRRNILEKTGPYREDLYHFVDGELWIRFAKESKLANLGEALVFHHKSDETYFARNFSGSQKWLTSIRLSIIAIRTLHLPPTSYAFTLAKIFYPIIPVSLRRNVRKMVSQIQERSLVGPG